MKTIREVFGGSRTIGPIDSCRRNLPDAVFRTLGGGIHKQLGGWESKQYGCPTDANAALRDALLRLGRIRE